EQQQQDTGAHNVIHPLNDQFEMIAIMAVEREYGNSCNPAQRYLRVEHELKVGHKVHFNCAPSGIIAQTGKYCGIQPTQKQVVNKFPEQYLVELLFEKKWRPIQLAIGYDRGDNVTEMRTFPQLARYICRVLSKYCHSARRWESLHCRAFSLGMQCIPPSAKPAHVGSTGGRGNRDFPKARACQHGEAEEHAGCRGCA